MRATQAPTGRRGGPVRIRPARQERLRAEVCAAGMIGEEGDASPAPAPLVVLAPVIASIRHLDRLGPAGEGESEGTRAALAVAPFTRSPAHPRPPS